MGNGRLFTGESHYIDKDGYKYIKFNPSEDEMYAAMFTRNYAPEHRIVMAKHLKRIISKDEHIHHKDKNRLNNEIDNLLIHHFRDHINEHVRNGDWKLFSSTYQPKSNKKWHARQKVQKSGLFKKAILPVLKTQMLKNIASANTHFPNALKKMHGNMSHIGGSLLEHHTDVPHELMKTVGEQTLGAAGRLKNRFMKNAARKFDSKQVAMGMKVELEHKDITGGDKKLTRKIVNAHLKELPDYYTRLKKMEKGAHHTDEILKRRLAPLNKIKKLKNSHHLINDFGYDDLDHVETMMDLENKYKVNITDNDAAKLNTVGSVRQFIDKYKKINKTASIIDKMIEERKAPKKYISEVSSITTIPSKNIEPYVRNLTPHKFFVTPVRFAKDIQTLHDLKSKYDTLKTNEGLADSKKHKKNLNKMMGTWIDSHNTLYKKYSGTDNSQFLDLKKKFQSNIYADSVRKRKLTNLVKKAALSQRSKYMLGGAVVGGLTPNIIHYFAKKENLAPDQKKEEIFKRIRHTITGAAVGATAGNVLSAVKTVKRKEEEELGTNNFSNILKNVDPKKIMTRTGISVAIGSIPGVIRYSRAKDEESKNKALKSIARGAAFSAALGSINRFSNSLQK